VSRRRPERPSAQRPAGASYDLALRGERVLVRRLVDGCRVVVLSDLAAIVGRIAISEVAGLPEQLRPELVRVRLGRLEVLAVTVAWLEQLARASQADVPLALEPLVIALSVSAPCRAVAP